MVQMEKMEKLDLLVLQYVFYSYSIEWILDCVYLPRDPQAHKELMDQ